MVDISHEFVFSADGDHMGPPVATASLSFAADEAYPSVSLLDLTTDSCGGGALTVEDNHASGMGLPFPRVLFPDKDCEILKDGEGEKEAFENADAAAAMNDGSEGMRPPHRVFFPEEEEEHNDVKEQEDEEIPPPFELDESHILDAENNVDVTETCLEVETSLMVGEFEDAVETSLIVSGIDEAAEARNQDDSSYPQDTADLQEGQGSGVSFSKWADDVMETSLLSTSVCDVTESLVESLCITKLERSCGNADGADGDEMVDGPCNIVSPCGPFKAGRAGACGSSTAMDSSFVDASAIWRDLENILGSAIPPSTNEIMTLRGLMGGSILGELLAGEGGENKSESDTKNGSSRKRTAGRKRRARNRAGEPMRVRAEWIHRIRMRMGDRNLLDSRGSIGCFRRRSYNQAKKTAINRAWSVDDHDLIPVRASQKHGTQTKGTCNESFEQKHNPLHFGRIVGDCFGPEDAFKDGSGISETRSRSTDTSKSDCCNTAGDDEDSVCYDSDPGEVVSRSKIGRYDVACDESPGHLNFSMKDDSNVQMGVINRNMDGSGASERESLWCVQVTLNQTLHLTWHPCVDSGKASGAACEKTDASPRCVRLWFERGYSIGEGKSMRLIEPKLVWRDALDEADSSSNQKEASSHNREGQFSLLDVCRLLHTTAASGSGDGVDIDRRKYPTARASCSFIVRTVHDEEFLFEARTEAERNNIAYKWKAAISRLASIIIIENSEAMMKEFFLPQNFLKSAECLLENGDAGSL